MKFLIIVLLGSLLQADIVKMEDGNCYERKGKISYIAPCPTIKKKSSETKQAEQSQRLGGTSEGSGKCFLKIEGYSVEFVKPKVGNANTISCGDSQEYFNAMSLGYDKSLKKNKVKIGDIVVKKGLSKCFVELYYGDFMTIGFMSGDRFMCDDFMVYHSMYGSQSRRR